MIVIDGEGYPENHTPPGREFLEENEEIVSSIGEELDGDVVSVSEAEPEENTEVVELAASPQYIQRQLSGNGNNQDVFNANFIDLRRTLMGVELALETGEDVYNPAGGHHHAHRGGTSAPRFNKLNDISGAAEYAKKRGVDEILVVDLDVHQSDGTVADMRKDPDVSILSMHQWDNFPGYDSGWKDYTGSGEGRGTVFNYPLPDGVTGEVYNSLLEEALGEVMEESDPDLVLYQAGRDVHHQDSLGELNLDLNEIYRRDRQVMEKTDAPVVVMGGGGYGPKAAEAAVNTAGAAVGTQIYEEESGHEPSEANLEKIDTWYDMALTGP
jgi:acetoin utilization deacetylase AcuC-like enzyme